MAHRQVLLRAHFLYKGREGLPVCVLPLHHHRHCTNVSFTAVLDMDVFPHCVSGQCPLVSNVPVEVLDALCVSAGKRQTKIVPFLFLQMRYIVIKEYRMFSSVAVMGITFRLLKIG